MNTNDIVVGIDLGTTNSAVAAVLDGRPQLLPVGDGYLLPSVVGIDSEGAILVGASARNQQLLYPERTVSSVKRRMGEEGPITMAGTAYSAVELSAMILRQLKMAAEAHLKRPVSRAVITVPAFFSDAQRTATREAGAVAGLSVERIINEPTAASLCYVPDDDRAYTFLVFDLGGGTFDVSIVRSKGHVTEVLASRGDTALGGDDFDEALVSRFVRHLRQERGWEPNGDLRAASRLSRAAERAKIRLSADTFTAVIEEHLGQVDDAGVHLDLEIARADYEELIRPLLDRTLDCVQSTLREAGMLPRHLDDVVLVGGSTHTPLVGELLKDLLGQVPRRDVDPETVVALGAALQGARTAGDDTGRILVDVSPFSFGTCYVGHLYGRPSEHCYKAIIPRNMPLPTCRTDAFYTMVDGQSVMDVTVYQGDDDDARKNIPLGRFSVTELDERAAAGSPIDFGFELDLDGILKVRVTERRTGTEKQVVIEDTFRKLAPDEIAKARQRIAEAMGGDEAPDWLEGNGDGAPALLADEAPATATPPDLSGAQRTAWISAASLLEEVERVQPGLGEADRDEVDLIATNLQAAMAAADFGRLSDVSAELGDVLFYLQ